MKLLRWLALVGATALLVGCGGGDGSTGAEEGMITLDTKKNPLAPPQPRWYLRLTLDNHPSAENVGILMASERGYFSDLRISVLVSTPATTGRPVRYVMDGRADIGVTHQPQVAMAQERGKPVVAFGSLVSQPTMAMIWPRKSGIEDVSDLQGKTVAILEAPVHESFLEIVLARAGLTLADVKLRRVERDLAPELAGGRADAIFGGSRNVEGAELEAGGMKVTSTPVTELGIPPFDELVLFAQRDFASEEPELMRRFRVAVARGAAAAIEDPRAAVEVILETPGGEPARKATEAAVEATLPLLSKTGRVSPARTRRLVEWMQEQGHERGGR
ncbi:MAG TPA: ABC transporter substrate-binding protein [Solirubrobacterales bacterium]|nr:ABC transporter substrate-binding protein [Solirubrobacterales bacterium]